VRALSRLAFTCAAFVDELSEDSLVCWLKGGFLQRPCFMLGASFAQIQYSSGPPLGPPLCLGCAVRCVVGPCRPRPGGRRWGGRVVEAGRDLQLPSRVPCPWGPAVAGPEQPHEEEPSEGDAVQLCSWTMSA